VWRVTSDDLPSAPALEFVDEGDSGASLVRPALEQLRDLAALGGSRCSRFTAPTAWYRKPLPIFADALAVVRRQLWAVTTFPTSPADADLVKVPRALVDHLRDLLCYAA
jgi:hypothetical protein